MKNAGTPAAVVENRLAGGAANPYIVMAATVAAGLAGITNKYTLPKRAVNALLPTSLSEALDALEKDKVLVKALGREFVQCFVRHKREFEVEVLTGGSITEEVNMYLKLF